MSEENKVKRRENLMLFFIKNKGSDFLTVKEIAQELGDNERSIRSSINPVKKDLADLGLGLANKLGKGYKIATREELITEANKACKRSLANVISMLNLIGDISRYTKDTELLNQTNALVENVKNIKLIFNDAIDDLSPDELDDVMHDAEELLQQVGIPKHISSIAEEYVEKYSPKVSGGDDSPNVPDNKEYHI